jgi:hypothetical protein
MVDAMTTRWRSLGAAGLAALAAASVASGTGAHSLRPSSTQRCPNPYGGACIGPLVPGRTYTTTQLIPSLSYSVPTRGWRNYEDYPGGFLLLPPRNSLAGVDAETSDFVGVDTSIAAARFDDLPSCTTERVPGVANTPDAIARWIRRRPELRVSSPSAASVGGLRGLRVDVRARPGARLPTCTSLGDPITVLVLFRGLPPSDVEQGVAAGTTLRLYLLRYRGGTLAIQMTDKDHAPGTLRQQAAVVERFAFGL